MAVAIELLLSRLFLSSSSSFSHLEQQQKPRLPMLCFLLFFLSLFSFFFLFVSLYKMLKRSREEDEKSIWDSRSIFRCSLPSAINEAHHTSKTCPLLFETLISKLPDLASLIALFHHDSSIERDGVVGTERLCDGSELGKYGNGDLGREDYGKGGEQNGKKKKKRAKKKKSNLQSDDGGEEPGVQSQLPALLAKHSSDCFYPFTSSSSLTQRKIKLQYDQLVKSHDSKALTLAQVSQFVNCLVEARTELQHKSEIIQRRFTITKALLFKADRSSFDRLSQQIYKLEAEQKRLEEDALVYNRLQQQLKLSPAYRQMLEIGARMELKANSDQLMESTDAEFANLSFEEFLAQEKKDKFWRRNGKLRSCTN